MSAPTPSDLAYLPDVEYALAKVAYADPDGLTIQLALYRAAQAALQAAGRPTVPLGTFNRLVMAAGFPRTTTKRSKVRTGQFFTGLNLRDDAA